MRIKLRKTDVLFSKYIRSRDGWRCKVCRKQYPEGDKRLQNSHFWGRANESTRFDPLNCDAMCFHCHTTFGSNPELFREWKLKQLGEKEYKLLMLRAHTIQKRDDKLTMIWLRQLK